MQWGVTRFVLAGLVHGARRQLGVAAGVALASAVLVGALAVGDSVRGTLTATASARTGAVSAVLPGGDRFFRADLCAELARALEGARVAPVLQLLGTAATPRGERRVHDVRVHGVDSAFFALAPDPQGAPPPPEPRKAYVSEAFAAALGVAVGDAVVVRVERPSAIPRDLALAPDDNSAALRVEVARILSRGEFGEFALDAAPTPAPSVFVDLAWLQRQMEVEGEVNLALLADGAGGAALAAAEAALERGWQLADAGLAVEPLADGTRELVTRRIFFDTPIVAALEDCAVAPLTGVFTYFVNGLSVGARSVPYSMVAGIGPIGRHAEHRDPLLAATSGLGAGELRLNSWAQDELAPAPGADITLDYYVVDASRRLVTRQHTFTFAGAVPDVAGEPLLGSARGRELMPAFPGLADADSCREWEPGTPVDLERIRDVDERYWDDHRGTPKAYMDLAAARALWTSRFGALTGVRFAPESEAAVQAALRAALRAADVGLVLRDVQGAAQRAGASSTDFGGLFIGLSFFLLVAALALATQLLLFGVEGRARELGLMRAVGVGRARVQRLVLGEAAAVAGLGALVGAPLGLLYTQLVLRGLETVWAGAVARTALQYHFTPASVALGAVMAFCAALGAAWFALRGLRRRTPLGLLTSERGVLAELPRARGGRWTWPAVGALALAAVALAATTDPRGGAAASGRYFGAGALALAAALGVVRAWLGPRAARAGSAPQDGFVAAAVTNARRRRARSFATVSSLALGVFLVLSVGVHRLGPVRAVQERASGTGGFAYYGRTSLPLLHDLDTAEGRAFFGLEDVDLSGVEFVRLRVRDGDDASCLNLARPSAPRLLGVDPEAFARRGAFSFAGTSVPTDAPWRLLDAPEPDGPIPAIGDVTSLTWQLKLGVGDTLRYTDERGRPFDVRIVGALADTVLQGDLIISERHFEERFPGQSGHRRLLIDAPPERAAEVGAALSRALADIGLALEGTGERLDRFHSVQNTYLAIFQALGALGLLVGTLGLALVVLRNIQERRGELALLAALGFTAARRARFVFAEHAALLAAALAAGSLGAAFAVLPAVASEGQQALRQALTSVALVAATGALATLAATLPSARRITPAALREE